MKNFKLTSFLLLLIFMNFFLTSSYGQEGVKLTTSPNEAYEHMIKNPGIIQNPLGEGFCWNARVDMDQFIENYQLTKNTGWLDAGVKYYDFLIGKMDTDPDGYKGWIGPVGRRYWSDALVGDAILLSSILDFCVLVLENKDLKKIYGDKADSYVEVAKKDFVEKYDKRGSWYEDGPYASYIGTRSFTKTDSKKEWVESNRPGISNPFNKLFDAAQVLIRLYRITGDKIYWNKAEKIFFTAKSHFQYFDDHYCWNYYEPLTPGDVDVERNNTRHWVDVHMWRSGYQASEIDKIVEAYHYGMVFDEQDIKRIINTNLNVMWNKDKVNPKFINSNGLGADGDTSGLASFQRAYGHSNVVKNSGELWTGLLDFDQTIRDLYELRFKGDKQSPDYIRYKNTVLVNPPGFKRKYAKANVSVPIVNFTECRDLYCAVVLPHKIPKDGKSVIICKSRVPGELQVDLYSKENKKLINFYTGKIGEGFYTTTWDGKDPANKTSYKGEYKIRWTTAGGYREFPVVVD